MWLEMVVPKGDMQHVSWVNIVEESGLNKGYWSGE